MKSNSTGKCSRVIFVGLILSSLIFCSLPAAAQPSGGPYGPIQQSYELPKDAGKIYYVSPDGKAEASGMTLDEPTTIESAIERVVTGDAIVVRGGVYRTGGLKLNQAVTIQPYRDEQPVLKGTFVADKWEKAGERLWKTQWCTLFPEKPDDWWRDKGITPLHRFNNDMVFVDGRFLQSAGNQSEVNKDLFYIDYDAKEVYIGVEPQGKLVEITAFDSALTQTTGKCHGKAPDGKGPTIRGITFTQYAFRAIEIEGKYPEGPSAESEHGKDVVGTTFENCAITFCSRVAGYFKGDKLTIRNCLVSDTSTEGLYIIASADILLEKNILRRNNIENITGYYPAAVKIFNQCYRAVCRDNMVTDLVNSNGIWYDVGEVDGVIVDNWFQNVGHVDRLFTKEHFWPSDNAFFFEISKGAVVAGNVFVNCDQGVFVLNSNNVKMYNNTFVNSTACIGRTARSAVGDHFGWHPSTGPDVDKRDGHVFVNNLLTGNENFERPLLAFSQQASLCGQLTEPQVKQLDYNVYVRGASTSAPLIYWSPTEGDNCQAALNSPQELHKLRPEFAANSKYFADYNGPLFKSPKLGDYQLLEAFAGARAASEIPSEIGKLLGLKTTERFVGAYPPIQ